MWFCIDWFGKLRSIRGVASGRSREEEENEQLCWWTGGVEVLSLRELSPCMVRERQRKEGTREEEMNLIEARYIYDESGL
jgi:hypothetical protein